VDSNGATIDCSLSEHRDTLAAHTFLLKSLGNDHTIQPRVITTDCAPTYPKAIADRQKERFLSQNCTLRQSQYLNNLVEQDHRFIKRLVKPGRGFGRYLTAWSTIRGFEAMPMIRKGQVLGIKRGDSQSQCRFIQGIFDLAS
jgi:transposase-like protein